MAIAKACGRVQRPDGFWFPENMDYGTQGIPNYFNDLNAMHEAEKVLFPKHEAKWAEYMSIVCGHSWRIIWTATAAQRAEAFLRTLDLWKP